MSKKRITPYFLIHKDQFNKNCSDIEKNFRKEWGENVRFAYSIKTNNRYEMISLAKQRGWMAEVVSQDEYILAEKMGYCDNEVICNGPIKENMIAVAVQHGQTINLDSLHEVDLLIEAINRLQIDGDKSNIGLRVNCDLRQLFPGEATAEDGISRFGICVENGDFDRAVENLRRNGIPISGIHLHCSTKTRSTAIFEHLSATACKIDERYHLKLAYIDMGGGFFGGQIIDGKPLMSEYASVICQELKKRFSPSKVTLILEPGASVAATAVDYIATVKSVKNVQERRIVTLDGTFLHINPFLARREVSFDTKFTGSREIVEQCLCGCTCMEMDRFVTVFNQQELLIGSEIVFHNVGAYTCSFNGYFIVNPPDICLD